MIQTKYFNIQVPELGDQPDITQVSNAISDLEDALAGTIEFMNATVSGTAITLASATRTTNRTAYHNGMTLNFTMPVHVNPNYITTIKVDGLPAQTAQIPFEVNANENIQVVYIGNKFIGQTYNVAKSSSISSSSTSTVATSNAVKQVNDKTNVNSGKITSLETKVNNERVSKTTQVIAGNGLTGGGTLGNNVTLNVASTTNGIAVSADGISLNLVNATNSTSTTQAPTANAVKIANDNANTGISKANTAQSTADSAVSKANTAQSRADGAYSLATTANNKADTAQNTANTAVGKANTAQSRADGAYNLASTANGTANNALGRANTAQSRADSAYNLANGKMNPSVGNNVLHINGWAIAIV